MTVYKESWRRPLPVRLHPQEREIIRLAAAQRGQPMSEFAREAALKEARRILPPSALRDWQGQVLPH